MGLVLAGCPPASWDDFSAELHQRACDRSVACGEVAVSERALCHLPAELQSLLQRSDFDIEVALAAGHLSYVPDGAGRCLDAVSAAPCDQGAAASRFLLGCNNVLRPATVVGNLCWAPDQCQGGTCVQSGTGCVGQCVAYPSPGASCSPTSGAPQSTCDPTVEYCDFVATDAGASDGICRSKHQAGGACVADEQCGFGLVCSRGACSDPPSLREGDPCAGSICAEHIYCGPAGLCVRQRLAYQTCDSVVGCDKGLACVGLELPMGGAALIPGLCRPWFDVGAACDPLVTVTGCPASTGCIKGSCVARQDDAVSGFGATCDDFIKCATGLICESRRCREPVGRGGACVDSKSCNSGLRCDSDQVCVAFGTCP